MALERNLKEDLRQDIINDEPDISEEELEREVNREFARNIEEAQKINVLLKKSGFQLLRVKEESYHKENEMTYYNLFIECDGSHVANQLKRIFSRYQHSYDESTRILIIKAIPEHSSLFDALVEGVTTRLYDKYEPLLYVSRSGAKRKSLKSKSKKSKKSKSKKSKRRHLNK
jgi:hypothetical protein